MPPVTLEIVSLPLEYPTDKLMLTLPQLLRKCAQTNHITHERSVTWTKVSLNDAKILATPNTTARHPEVSVFLSGAMFGAFRELLIGYGA